jgi:hypothetical protein
MTSRINRCRVQRSLWFVALLSWSMLAAAASPSAVVTSLAEPANAQSTSCSTTCTLREAINLAQATGGIFTITFASSIDGGTIALSNFSNPAGCNPFPCGAPTTQFGPSAFFVHNSLALTIDGLSGLKRGITISRCTDSAGCYGGTSVPSFRLFHVEAGSSLSIYGLTLRDGLAQGGSSTSGGGALGAGGAIFNQGTLTVFRSTLVGNIAQGGNGNFGVLSNDGTSLLGGAGVGGNGGTDQGGPPNGGGVFPATGGFGGGGGGGYDAYFPNVSEGYAANAGFGGGGGSALVVVMYSLGGTGGFGGGGGAGTNAFSIFSGAPGGTFGGNGDSYDPYFGGGGAGLGGAIFNDAGIVSLIDSTLTNNGAAGGAIDGSGAGGAVFNYNGSLTLNYVTMASNTVSSDPTTGYSIADGGVLYSLGDSVGACSAGSNPCTNNTATLTIDRTIAVDSIGATSDVVIDSIHGTDSGGSSSTGSGAGNLIAMMAIQNGGTSSIGIIAGADPKLGILGHYGGTSPVRALASSSIAVDALSCDDGPSAILIDQRGVTRPQGAQCDIGAYEYDGDYIYASGFDP